MASSTRGRPDPDPVADVRPNRRGSRVTRQSAWAVALALLSVSAPVAGAAADLHATRPFATPAAATSSSVRSGVTTVPTVAPNAGFARGFGVDTRGGHSHEGARGTDGLVQITAHSPAFLTWAARHDKLVEYCAGASPPCEESLHREAVWTNNAVAIELHNREGGSLMKKGLTRFADLTETEFTAAHATYAGGVPVVAPLAKGTSYGQTVTSAPSRRFGRESRESTPTEGPIFLKRATDEAAIRGDALPSENDDEDEETSDASSVSLKGLSTTPSHFPALGASAGLTQDTRMAAQSERRRARRAATRAAEAEAALGFGNEKHNTMRGPLGSGLANHFDWSEHLDFGEIVHQGACAGCWAYSTAAVVEAAQFVHSGRRQRMSPYSLIDCDTLDHGCATGNMASAYAWIQTSEFGLPPLERYPALSSSGQCSVGGLGAELGANAFSPDGVQKDPTTEPTSRDEFESGGPEPLQKSKLGSSVSPSSLFGGDGASIDARGRTTSKDGTPIHIPTGNARVKGYCDLPVLHSDSEKQLLRALAQQPVAVGVNIHALQFYESGIVQLGDCPPASVDPLKAINHAAVLTGWGFDEQSGQHYWILRNTYGDRWGEAGYARLAFGRDEQTGFGACALYTEGNYPLVGTLQCTPGATRKEAVRHGAYVWLYPGGYNMGPHVASVDDGLFPALRDAVSGFSQKMQRFNLGFGEENRVEVIGAAAFLVLAAVVTIAAQATTLAKLRREARVGTAEERTGFAATGTAGYVDDVLE